MKKITLLLAITFVCSSAFSMRYLVQTGATGGATWRPASSTETIIDLTVNAQSLNAWLTATTFASGDEVWIASGNYVFSAAYTYVAAGGPSFYGGFAGTETDLSQRAKGTNQWDFTNTTIFDGNNASKFIVAGKANVTYDVTIDGITFQNGNSGDGQPPVQQPKRISIKNCKFLNNISIKTAANGTGMGGALQNNGGNVESCYFFGNQAGYGGALHVANSAGDNTSISNCLFEANAANQGGANTGGAMRINGVNGILTVDRCTFINNDAKADGAGLYILQTVNNATAHVDVSNCLFYANTTKAAIYLYGGNLYNCTVVNNPAGGLWCGGTAVESRIYNSVFWGASSSGNLGAVANHTLAEVQNTAYKSIGTGFNGPLVMSNIMLDANNNGTDLLAYYPNFADPENNNWQIAQGSALIDAGQTIPTITTDFLGNARPYGASNYDIGAYEFDPTTTVNHTPIDYNFSYFSDNNMLEIRGVNLNTPIKIYNLSGSIVKSLISTAKDISVDLANGVYILRVGEQAVKVVIK